MSDDTTPDTSESFDEPSASVRRRNLWTGLALLLAILVMVGIHTLARIFGW